jgi:ABC-2 type transport system ATP-binding protein
MSRRRPPSWDEKEFNVTEPAIDVQRLRKVYGNVVAVDDLSVQVQRGEIFGLLGPNGAGKTTTIRMLMDIIKPDSGSARILGRTPGAARQRLGYMPEERGLYRQLSVLESLEYLGQLKGMRASTARARAIELLTRVELAAWGKHKVQELSRGMQQKIQLIACIIHDPDLIILDEPFQGLDPVNLEIVKQIISEQRTLGKTIVLSAHEMSQVEALCERIALIHHGRAVLYGELADIKKRFSPNALEISPPLDLGGWPQVARVESNALSQMVYLKAGCAPRDLLKKLIDAGMPVEQFKMASVSLEQIFVTVVTGGSDEPA